MRQLLLLLIFTIYSSLSTAQRFNQTLTVAYNFDLARYEITSALIDNEDDILHIETFNITNDADVRELYVSRQSTYTFILVLHPAILERFPNIEKLFLRDVSMKQIPRNALENCEKITEIDLSYNRFTQITPLAFRNCGNLKVLSFEWNLILNTTSGDDLVGLTNLEKLDLSYNSLESINEDFFIHTPNLRELNLMSNYFNNFSAAFLKHATKLQVLDLFSSRIDNIDSSSSFPSSLQKLIFSGMRFSEIPSNTFKNLNNLEILQFTGNYEVSDGSNLPPGLFEPLTGLKELHLNFTYMRRLNSNTFGYHENLTHLYLPYVTLREIEPNFFDNFPKLNVLDLTGNQNCYSGIIFNANSADLDSLLERCYNNWLGIEPTTTPWPNDGDNTPWWVTWGFSMLGVLIIFIVFFSARELVRNRCCHKL